jgi:hypothetical protein
LFFEDQGSMHWDCTFDITDAVVFLILREVLTLLLLLLLLLESSGYQCQDGIKHPLQHFPVTFMGDTQMLLHIIRGVKASITAKRDLKF